jgi:hypothetical protein
MKKWPLTVGKETVRHLFMGNRSSRRLSRWTGGPPGFSAELPMGWSAHAYVS